jgi:hypothetical protein
MDDSDYGVVLFYSTSAAIRAEKLTKEEGLKVKLVPVPRHLSSDCGVCLRFESLDADKVRAILEEARVEFERIRAL